MSRKERDIYTIRMVQSVQKGMSTIKKELKKVPCSRRASRRPSRQLSWRLQWQINLGAYISANISEAASARTLGEYLDEYLGCTRHVSCIPLARMTLLLGPRRDSRIRC